MFRFLNKKVQYTVSYNKQINLKPQNYENLLNTLFKPGLRISRPTITTFFPNKERLIARFEEIKDLPSPLTVEVTSITF